MSELKATPGPWRVESIDDGCGFGITAAKGEAVVWWADKDEPENGIENRHDAHLIAQSPAMYESLSSAPNPSKYAGKAGFEADRFLADYETWMDERRKIMAAARGES